jgi:drug/metabolite transporter (DMT)-like permease
VLASAVLWSIGGPTIKVLAAHGVPAGAIAMYRSLFAALVLLPAARRLGGASIPLGWLITSVLASAVAYFCFVTATVLTEAANAIVLQYTFTCWVFVLSPLLLRERARRRDWFILGWAMVGVGIIFWGQRQTDLLGLSVALGAGLAVGVLVVALRRLRHVNPAFVICVNQFGTAVLLMPFVGLHLAIAWVDWGLLAGLGWFQIGLPYVLFALGMRHLQAQEASLLTLVEPVLNPAWTYVVVREVPTPTTFIGGACILGSLAAKAVTDRRAAAHAGRLSCGRTNAID